MRVAAINTRPDAFSAWSVVASGLSYEPFGSPRAMALDNGLAVSNSCDDAGQITAPRLYRAAGGADVTTVWQRTAQPFGETYAESGSIATVLRFPGQVADAATATHYNMARDYDPSLGRYLQSDPIGLAGGWNTYGYVGGNPVSRVDPEGRPMKASSTPSSRRHSRTRHRMRCKRLTAEQPILAHRNNRARASS